MATARRAKTMLNWCLDITSATNTSAVTINSLTVGSTTRQFTDQGRNLSLNNVNLNPLSWQVYVSQSNGYPVTVSNSKINEIAAYTNGLVNISNSTLQLATTGAVGPGSQMNITGSQIWSSAILAENGGHTSITTSQIHGSYISATGSGSRISMSSATDYRNGSSSASCPNPVGPNGTPVCNPFNPLGQCAKASPQNGGVVTGTGPASSRAGNASSNAHAALCFCTLRGRNTVFATGRLSMRRAVACQS